MNLDDLRAAQVDERGTDSLQPLRPSFYEDAAAYLAELHERRDRLAEEVDDPYAEEVQRLTDELETAEEVVEAIYDRRVGKLVKRASLAAAGMPTDEDGLTDEERELYRDLVDRIEANRAEVLDALEGGSRAEPTDPEPAPEPPADVPEDAGVDAADAMGAVEGASAAPDEAETAADADERPEPDGGSAEPADTDRLTVRITAPVGEIYGVDDRVYTLDAEDVVTLPEPNAKPLLDRGAAQRVE